MPQILCLYIFHILISFTILMPQFQESHNSLVFEFLVFQIELKLQIEKE